MKSPGKKLRWTIVAAAIVALSMLLPILIARYQLKVHVAKLVETHPKCPALLMQAMSCTDIKRDAFRLWPSAREIHLSRLLLRDQFGTSRLPFWRVASSDFASAWALNDADRAAVACALAPDGGGLVAYASTVLDRPLAEAAPLDQVFIACSFDQPKHVKPELHRAAAKIWLDSFLSKSR